MVNAEKLHEKRKNFIELNQMGCHNSLGIESELVKLLKFRKW